MKRTGHRSSTTIAAYRRVNEANGEKASIALGSTVGCDQRQEDIDMEEISQILSTFTDDDWDWDEEESQGQRKQTADKGVQASPSAVFVDQGVQTSIYDICPVRYGVLPQSEHHL